MKKLLALALVMVFALSLLTACGGGGGNSSTPSGGNNSTSTPPASNTPKDNHSDLNVNNIKTDLIYNPKIVSGYYIPCYKLYVEKEKLTNNKNLINYLIIYIPLVDIDDI